MNRFLYFVLAAATLLSCVSEDGEKEVSYQDKYSLSIPAFLTKVNNLNEDASLQYQHAWKEFYVIVIDEPKSEMKAAIDMYNLSDTYSNDLEGYSKLVLETIDLNGKADIRDSMLNNMPARIFTLQDRMEGIDIYYVTAVVEGKENYYQIMTWTLAEKKFQYQDKMNQILHSFKEL